MYNAITGENREKPMRVNCSVKLHSHCVPIELRTRAMQCECCLTDKK